MEMTDLYENYANCDKTHTTCTNQVLGKEFISFNVEKPDGFCNRAWNAFQDKVKLLASGKNSPWVNREGLEIVSCPDGLHPVIYKLDLYKLTKEQLKKRSEKCDENAKKKGIEKSDHTIELLGISIYITNIKGKRPKCLREWRNLIMKT